MASNREKQTDSGRPTSPERRDLLRGSLIAAGAVVAPSAAAAASCNVTPADILGPFHRPGAPVAKTMNLAPEEEPGQRLMLSGKVYGDDCGAPLKGALLDIWHADDKGAYDMPDYLNIVSDTAGYRLRRHFVADADGGYSVSTIVPGRYEIPPGLPNFEKYAGQIRPSHIHLIVLHPGYAPLITQLYFEGDPYIADDPWAHEGSNILKTKDVDQNGKTVQVAEMDFVLRRQTPQA